jgi:adenosine 3'-phospho 5'-phosphosulfate transporter B2
MTTRQMISICISAVVFGHKMSYLAVLGAGLVFAVLFYQIRAQHQKKKQRNAVARV